MQSQKRLTQAIDTCGDSLPANIRRSSESTCRFTTTHIVGFSSLRYSRVGLTTTRYIDHFHPFFPVADKCILTHTPATVSSLIDSEPHLVTAIFTVASKDEPSMTRVHEACSRYMETLISKLIYKGSTTVGAVEALLILAQWAPQRLQEKPTVGRGEEDEGAWMQIGVAIRLGYLQSLEQTGLLSDKTSPSSETFRRKRLVWAGKPFLGDKS